MARETPRAAQAYLDYLAMEGRSIDKLHRLYLSRTGDVPTDKLQTLRNWSAQFKWQDRVRAFEAQQTASAEAAVAAARRDVFTRGLALDYERVRVLQDIAGRLIKAFRGLDPAVAQVRRVTALVNAIDRVLDSIAKETGGRQPSQTVAFFLRDYARTHAAEFNLTPDEAVAEVEALLSEFHVQ